MLLLMMQAKVPNVTQTIYSKKTIARLADGLAVLFLIKKAIDLSGKLCYNIHETM